jgi:hypothetical protein
MPLNVKAFTLTCGLLWGLCIFFLTWWLIVFGGETVVLESLGDFYLGYSVTPSGSFIGLVYGMIDGALAGLIFSWLYNVFARRFPSRSDTPAD